MVKGAVGDDVGETLPQEVAPLHDTVQSTPLFAESFVTVAVIRAVPFAGTVVAVDEAETTMADVDVPPPHPAIKPNPANKTTSSFFTLPPRHTRHF